ncbi:MAG: tetratricopeptide repeat protein [bacterium]|nr:tetratricopeptide repeat protein [bacterium]
MAFLKSRTQKRAALLALLILSVLATGLAWSRLDRSAASTAEASALAVAEAQRRIDEQQRQGHYTQALYQVRTLAEQQGWTADLYQQAGDLYAAMNDLSGAAASWEAARQLAPARSIIELRRLAQTCLDLGRWAQAADVLGALLEQSPDDAWANYRLGLLLAPSDPRRADAYLEVAARQPEYTDVASPLLLRLRAEQDNPLISMQVGLLLVEADLWTDAERAFQYAASTAAPYPEALAYVALAREQQGKDGTDWIQQAVALAPDSAPVRYVEGLYWRARNDFAASQRALVQAVIADPNNAALYAELGTAFQLVGDYEQAEHWLQIAVALAENEPHVQERFQELLALFYAETGYNLPEGGLELLRLTAEVLADDADARAAYGWGLYRTGQAEAGLTEIETALSLEADNSRALYYRALIALQMGETERGRELLNQVVAIGGVFRDEAAIRLQQLANQDG